VNYAELLELCRELKDEPFEVLAFPCNQFGAQEQGTNEEILAFVAGKLGNLENVHFTIFEKVHVNGEHTHPVYQFCKYNAEETSSESRLLPIGWNFSKFLIDKQGKVFKYYSPKVSPSSLLPDIRGLLSSALKARASRRSTVTREQAPLGFVAPTSSSNGYPGAQ